VKNSLADKFPKISKEWHPSKNGSTTPKDVNAGSPKKYWFKCEKGHEWKTSLNNRTSNKTKCPYCVKLNALKNNCLESQYPKIAKEWHPTKNGNTAPKDVRFSSHKKYWFKCEKGHEWRPRLSNRTSNSAGCPYCIGKKVCGDNCLETLYPEIAKEWHPIKNGKITPKDVVAHSNKKYWFQCNRRHEWKTELSSRTGKEKIGCPFCGNQKVCEDNCLETLYPKIAKEWHPTKNGKITPKGVLSGTAKKYWFQCDKNHMHLWKASYLIELKEQDALIVATKLKKK